MISYVNKHRKLSILIAVLSVVLIPALLHLLMQTLFANIGGGSDDGWLGFWGGYLGAVLSVAGVYVTLRIQLANEKENLQKQLVNDKENNFKIARPFFIVSFSAAQTIATEIYASENVQHISDSDRIICINNVSSKDMYAVKILVSRAV